MMTYLYIAMALAMVGLCFKGPRWGIAAMAFLLPISRRLPSPPIPLLNAQNLLVLVGLLALLARRKEAGRTTGIRFLLPLAGFALLATLGFANTMLFYVPARYYFMWDPYSVMIIFKTQMTCLLIYALGCMVAGSREDIETVFKGLMLGVAFEGLFVCLEVMTHAPGRANGHLLEGNNAGTYLAGALATALAAALVLGWKNRAGLFSIGASIAAAIGLIFTLSRGNWISGIVSSSAVSVLRDRRVLALIVLAVATYQLWLPEKAMERIENSFTTAENEPWRYRFREGTDEAQAVTGLQSRLLTGGDEGDGDESEARLDSSSQVRLYVWNAALRMIGDYPLGVGYGVFTFYIGYYSDVIKFRAAHNTYLLIACELGLPGLAVFLTLTGCLLFEAFMAYRRADDPLMKSVGLSALGAGVAMMVSAFFYNHSFIIEVNGQQWLLLGLATQVRPVLKAEAEVSVAPAASPAPEAEAVPLYRLIT